MNIKPLHIGNLVAELPIIQGGMGIGVSRSNLATAVANAGGIGVISAAQIGYDEEGFEKDPISANIKALEKHIKKAKQEAKHGIIGLNCMVAMTNYELYIQKAVEFGIDLIISGAGLPTQLPLIVQDENVKLAPIVSSGKAASTLLKVWDRKAGRTADLIVVEGPKAGGHLGFSLEQLLRKDIELADILKEVLEAIVPFEEKYQRKIPVVVAGGVFTGEDIAYYMSLGASGVQMATRFIATHECDAHENFKMQYVNRSEDEIELVKSPVGMPGRALVNKLVQTIKKENIRVKKCYNCLSRDHCDRVTIPYCISTKLIEAVKGDVDNGLLFCGENAHRIKKIVSVKELMEELVQGIKNYRPAFI